MNAALRRLLWLEARGQLRLAARRLRTRRGVLVAGCVLGLVVVLAAALAFSPDGSGEWMVGTEGFVAWGPLGLWALIGLGVFSPRGLYFKPAEVAFLFPAPLARHELVLFNVASRARMALLSALWLAALPSLRGRSFASALLGYGLVLVLVQVTGQWFAVARLWFARRRARIVSLLVVLAAVGALIAATRDLSLLAPLAWGTRPFILVLASDSLAAALPWAALCAGVLAALIASLCAMDVDYLEAALSGSRSAEQQRSRIRSGGVFAASKPIRRFSVARFPRLHGAGPIAWRQCMEAVRNPRGALLVLFVVLLGASAVVVMPAFDGETARLPPLLLPSLSLSMVFASSLMIGDNLAFDFRRDLDRLPLLKALPVSSLAIAAGQVGAATLFVSAIQLVGAAIVVGVSGVFPLGAVSWLLLVLPLANWSAIAIENALFLTMPYRTVAEDPGDVAFVGRLMLSMLLKLATIALVGGTAVGFGVLARLLAGDSFALGALAATLWLAAACVPLTLLVAHAFERFDVATDTPA